MRVICHLRDLRGERTLAEIAELSGVGQPDLSRIERGMQLPTDESVPLLEHAYGAPVVDWYAPQTLLALTGDDA